MVQVSLLSLPSVPVPPVDLVEAEISVLVGLFLVP